MNEPITAIYLWDSEKPFPDGIILKDASAITVDGRSSRVESYGRNKPHYQRETLFSSLVTRMYLRLTDCCDADELAAYRADMEKLHLEIPE